MKFFSPTLWLLGHKTTKCGASLNLRDELIKHNKKWVDFIQHNSYKMKSGDCILISQRTPDGLLSVQEITHFGPSLIILGLKLSAQAITDQCRRTFKRMCRPASCRGEGV
jgi:hypothetical protein